MSFLLWNFSQAVTHQHAPRWYSPGIYHEINTVMCVHVNAYMVSLSLCFYVHMYVPVICV